MLLSARQPSDLIAVCTRFVSRVKLRPTGEAAVLIECAELVLVLAALKEVLANPQGTLLELGPSEPLAEVSARSHRAAPKEIRPAFSLP